jgi:exonuclease I
VHLNEDGSVKDVADAIAKAAKVAKLDPQLYELAWFVRKTAKAERPVNDLN